MSSIKLTNWHIRLDQSNTKGAVKSRLQVAEMVTQMHLYKIKKKQYRT